MAPARVIQVATLSLFVGFLALLGIVGATLWLAARAQSNFQAVLDARSTDEAAVELRYALQAAEASQRGYLASGNEIYLAPYSTAQTLARRQYDAVEKLLASAPERGPVLQRLKLVIEDKIREMDETILLKRERRDSEALAVLRTNRGKALMDEANVFLSSLIREAGEKLTQAIIEQKENATLLRAVTLSGGALIILVVGIVIAVMSAYARDLSKARDEVGALNSSLERRVEERTAELKKARDRAETLLAEVNHRVANSLAIVSSMVRLQAKSAESASARDVLAETHARIYAVALIHRRLYTTGDGQTVALDEYLLRLLENLESSLQDAGHGASLRPNLEHVTLPTDQSVSLGVIATEWVTNAFKYAYPRGSGEIRVTLKRLDEARAELRVEDDGVGKRADQLPQGTGLGTQLVNAMAASMGAQVEYLERHPGTTARLIIPASAS
jgi:two-component sensor histidine kinase